MTVMGGIDNLLPGFVLPFALVVARVLAIMALLPVFGNSAIPSRVKLGLGLTVGVAIAPLVTLPEIENPAQFIKYLPTEVFSGLIIGIGVRALVQSLQIAGAIAAQSFAIAQNANRAVADPMPAVGNFILWAGLATALSLGFGHKVLIVFIQSYDALPFGQWPNAADILDRHLTILDFAFDLALQLALPFCATALIYNIILGAANKIMPQLMVMLVGAPAGMIAVIGILAAGGSLISLVWAQQVLIYITGSV